MSSLFTPKAHGGTQRRFAYARTDPSINAGFDDLQLTPKPSHNSGPSSRDVKSWEAGVEKSGSPLKAFSFSIEKSTMIQGYTPKTSISEYEVTLCSASEFESTFDNDDMDLDSSEDSLLLSKSKGPSSTSKCADTVPSPRTPKKVVKRTPKAKTPTSTPRKKAVPASTPRKKAVPASARKTPVLESLKQQVKEGSELAMAPRISPASNIHCFDDLPVFGVRYSRSSNSSKLTVDQTSAQTTLNEGGSGQDQSRIPYSQEVLSPSKSEILILRRM